MTLCSINPGFASKRYKKKRLTFLPPLPSREDTLCCFSPETDTVRLRILRGLPVQRHHACALSHSVTSDSLRRYGLWPSRLLCPWDSPGKNPGVDNHSLLQGIFPTQESNLRLLHCRWILYRLSHQGSPKLPQISSKMYPTHEHVNIHPTAKVRYKDYVQLILPSQWMRNPLSLPHIGFFIMHLLALITLFPHFIIMQLLISKSLFCQVETLLL